MAHDPISDMLTCIRNANLASQSHVLVPKTRMIYTLCDILKREGFINDLNSQIENPYAIGLDLKWISIPGKNSKKPAITNLKRISKPGLRIYAKYKDIPQVFGGMGIVIISTSQGIMTDRQARAQKLGGELICSVW